jgi:glutamine synthetase
MNAEHEKWAKDLAGQGVEYAIAAWIDVLGRPKSKVVPIDHLPNMLAGSERYTPRGMGGIGHMDPVEDEVVCLPDPKSMKVLPWDRRFVWFTADMMFGGERPFALCPRSALKQQVEVAANMGYVPQLGIEPEFYAFKPESLTGDRLIPIAISGEVKPSPAYDVETVLDAMPFLNRMTRYMEELGFGLFSFDAEGGEGQYEFDFAHAPIVETADKLTLFRLMARQAAKEEGLLVTFMPKPYANLWGSGAHFNMSLEHLDSGKNAFRASERRNDWTEETYFFVGGILKHAPALTALANPTTNSYRRLVPRLADGEISWAPTAISYGYNNRSCMLRLPHNRPAIENRAVDSAANTYHAAAFMLAAGLEGIRERIHPGDPMESLSYNAPVNSLPRTLIEAIDAFQNDPLSYEVFASAFVKDYVEMKSREWEIDHLDVTDREREKYLLNI